MRAVLALLLGLSVLLGPAQAQQANPPQILTLDQDRLYTASLYGKAIEAQLLAQTQDLTAQNRQIEADLSAEEASLTTQRKALSAAAFAKLAADFDAKVEKIRAEQEAKAKQLTTDRDTGRKQFFDAAVPVLVELMRKLGAYAILNRSSVVLAFDSIDVTDRAIAALDDQLGDGSKLPPPATP
jgi:Skp family chaperone for outer membrane proteins